MYSWQSKRKMNIYPVNQQGKYRKSDRKTGKIVSYNLHKKGNPRASKPKKVPSLFQNQWNKNESTMENHFGKQFAII